MSPHLSRTAIVKIDIGYDDANAIQKREFLAVNVQSTFLTMSSKGVTDMVNLPLKPIEDGAAQQAAKFGDDNVDPTLLAFDVNINKATVQIRFSETVSIASLQKAAFRFQASKGVLVTDKLNSFTPTLSLKTITNSEVLDFDIVDDDLNQIKARTSLATHKNDTFVMFGKDAIRDMRGNSIASVESAKALQVTKYDEDKTAPELMSFDATMTAGKPPLILTLRFSETVMTSSLNLTNIVLQAEENVAKYNSKSHNYAHAISSAVASRSASYTEIQLTIGASDLEAIRALENVVRTPGSTFVSLGEAITDAAGNSVKAISAAEGMPVTKHSADVTPPEVAAFDLDLTSDTLTVVFSENVNFGNFKIGNIRLQSEQTATSNGEFVDLSSTTHSSAGKTATVTLDDKDVDKIKQMSVLATDKSKTYLAVQPVIVQDIAENKALGIASSKALPARDYNPDRVHPEATGFDLDLQDGVLTVRFSEVINVSSFSLGQARIQDAKTNPTAVTAPLEGTPMTNQPDGTTVKLQLTVKSTNTLRALASVAKATDSTVLIFKPSFTYDVDRNEIKERKSSDGLVATSLTPDKAPPAALDFTIDMTKGQIAVRYEQPVNGTSLDVRKFKLLGAATGSGEFTLRSGTVNDGYTNNLDTVATITFSEADLNEIKRLSLCSADSKEKGCFLRFDAGSVVDSEGNAVPALGNLKPALSASKYTADTTRPSIVTKGFTAFNAGTGVITMKFSETMKRSTVNPLKLILQNHYLPNLVSESQTLNKFDMKSSQDGTSLTFTISREKLNLIKAKQRLCSTPSTCFIKAESGFIADMASNPLEATVATDVLWASQSYAQKYDYDKTQPVVESFDLNMDAHTATIYFDETVQRLTLNTTALTFHGSSDGKSSYRLTGGELTLSSNVPFVSIHLTDDDINAIKTLEICKTKASSFISVESPFIGDMFVPNANQVTPVAVAMPLVKGEYVADATEPKLVAFSIDLDLQQLTISFNEPVDTTTFDFAGFALLSSASSSPKHTQTLHNGSVIEHPSTASQIVTLQLAEADVVVLKKEAAFGTTAGNTFLAASAGAVKDTKNLPLKKALGIHAVKASKLITDKSLAKLLSYDLNMHDRQLVMTFNEIMDASTIRSSSLTLQNSKGQNPAESYSLSNSKSKTPFGYKVFVDLTDEDMLAMEKLGDLATEKSNTYLTMGGAFISDVFDRNAVGITDVNAQQVKVFTHDTVPPFMKSTTLDVGKGHLTLVFSKAINVTTFRLLDLSLQPAANLTSHNNDRVSKALPHVKALAIKGGMFTFETDAQSCSITLTEKDSDELKRRTDICSKSSNCFISYSKDLLADYSENAMVAAPSEGAKAIANYLEDKVSPTLVKFGLNMDTGTLNLEYDETIKADSVNVSAFTIQRAKNLTAVDSVQP